MLFKHTIYALAFWAIFSNSVFSQDSITNLPISRNIGLRYHTGIVIPHHANMAYFINDYSRGTELTYGITNCNKDNWMRYFNYPEIGIGLFYNTFGSNDIYGSGISLYPYIQSTLFRSSRFLIRNKVAFGLGYATKPYDIDINPNNHILGSHLNAYVGLGFYATYNTGNHWAINSNLSFNHLSNGAMANPNNGINTVTASIGVNYIFEGGLNPLVQKIHPPKSSINEILIVAGFGRSQSALFNPNYYNSFTFSAAHMWHRSEKNAWGLGIDLINYGAAPYVFNEFPTPASFSETLYVGVAGHYNIAMGKSVVFIQLGKYALYQIKPKQMLYSKIGLRYNITNHLLASFGVKASFFKAEFLEFGIGYSFKYNRR